MALTKKGAAYTYGTTGVAATGLAVVTGFEASREFETNQTAKDADGIVAAHLYGNEVNNASAEGYIDAATAGAADAPALTGTIVIGDIEVPVMRASVQGSNEDFVRARLEGSGYAAIDYGA